MPQAREMKRIEEKPMRTKHRRAIAFALSLLLVWPNLATTASPAGRQARPSLADLVNESYLKLLEIAPSAQFTGKELEDFKKQLERKKENEEKRLEREEKELKKKNEQLMKRLETLNKSASRDTEEMTVERRRFHCQVLKLENEIKEKKTEREHGLPIAFDNKRAKLELIQLWPSKKQEIAGIVASGRARERRFGDVEDIGIRKFGEGQEKDIKTGQDAINELKAYGLMPPEVEDKELTGYVQQLAHTVAINSDLKIPVRVTVLNSDEINAFALPGGFLFINTGLIDKAETESELVGVMAHELAHVSARHGARLMKRATIASIIYQAAQVAAMIFTGGVVGIGTYYALQYGFFGLGLALNLALLGVSREYEEEADQLGVQYAWRAGYDPHGFITFFDKLASEKGYVKSASFFRTHPPFFDRIVSTFSEIEYLPKKDGLQTDSSKFREIKLHMKQVKEELDREQMNRPTLKRMPPCDDEPDPKPIAERTQ
jgi:hypothetical protein